MRMKYKPGQVIARLYCEACNEERYVVVQARETWRCEGFRLREYGSGGQDGGQDGGRADDLPVAHAGEGSEKWVAVAAEKTCRSPMRKRKKGEPPVGGP